MADVGEGDIGAALRRHLEVKIAEWTVRRERAVEANKTAQAERRPLVGDQARHERDMCDFYIDAYATIRRDLDELTA